MHTGADPLWICSRLHPISIQVSYGRHRYGFNPKYCGCEKRLPTVYRKPLYSVLKASLVSDLFQFWIGLVHPNGPKWIRLNLVWLFYPIQTSKDSRSKLDQIEEVSCVRKAYPLQFGNNQQIRSCMHGASASSMFQAFSYIVK